MPLLQFETYRFEAGSLILVCHCGKLDKSDADLSRRRTLLHTI
jgi:hypothetical protein